MEGGEYREVAEQWLKAIRSNPDLRVADFLEQTSEAERGEILERICEIVSMQLVQAEHYLMTAREVSEITGRMRIR